MKDLVKINLTKQDTADITNTILNSGAVSTSTFSNSKNIAILPGLCDVHVHFREPGFSYKETIKSGSIASAKGGFTAVCTMPNLNPVPDSVEHLREQTDIIEKDAVIGVYPYGSITVGQKGEQLADLDGMAKNCIAFSDDGKGVQDDEMMLKAMLKAKELDKVMVCHCEVNSLLNGGYIHDGEYAKEHGHKGICSASEYEMVARDLKLVEKTGVKYHVCHISTKETVALIRDAKKRGLDVTCETGPHYLILDDSMLKEEGRFKMNPPIRSKADRDALVEGILDGTIDMIATDHAPHSAEEKTKGLKDSAFGVVGIETSFALMYTYFVKTGMLSLERLIELMSTNPAKRFNIDLNGDFCVWDLDKEWVVNPSEFLSQGKYTPFENYKLYGENLLTFYKGKQVYKKQK